MKKWNFPLVFIFVFCFNEYQYGQESQVFGYSQPDIRFKTDILLIVAHPDDETAVGGYLAKAIYDDKKRVGIVYLNRGSGGGNTYGREQARSLAAIREVEARKATASFGIDLVWFLDGVDTPSQDLFASLNNWGHGKILEDVVRIIRLTRPEIIITWLPHYVSGENHGDHQASGVITIEAFDLAGDPTVFPTQITPPREPMDINNVTEGLQPWQTKKLYFFSDASHTLNADGPPFDIRDISPSQNVPYYMLAAKLHLPHRTQGEVSNVSAEAIETGDFDSFLRWMSTYCLIFGKSVVPCNPKGDVFEGIDRMPSPYVPIYGFRDYKRKGVSLELGGVFAFYREFWKAHEIEHIGLLVDPEVRISYDSYFHVPLLLRNNTSDSVSVRLNAESTPGWREVAGTAMYRLAPGSTVPVQTFFFAPDQSFGSEHTLVWRATMEDVTIGSVIFKVSLTEWTLPQ